jgi:hypothetical protein
MNEDSYRLRRCQKGRKYYLGVPISGYRKDNSNLSNINIINSVNIPPSH